MLMTLISIFLVLFVGLISIKSMKKFKTAKNKKNSTILYLNSKSQFKSYFTISIILYMIAVVIIILGFIPATKINISSYPVYLVGLLPWLVSLSNMAILNDDSILINLYKDVKFEEIKYVKLETSTNKKKILILTHKGFSFYVKGTNEKELLSLFKKLENRPKVSNTAQEVLS